MYVHSGSSEKLCSSTFCLDDSNLHWNSQGVYPWYRCVFVFLNSLFSLYIYKLDLWDINNTIAEIFWSFQITYISNENSILFEYYSFIFTFRYSIYVPPQYISSV